MAQQKGGYGDWGTFSGYKPPVQGWDGYIDPNDYIKLRTDFVEITGDASAFDETFASLLSPQERARLGIGKTTGLNVSASGGKTTINYEDL